MRSLNACLWSGSKPACSALSLPAVAIVCLCHSSGTRRLTSAARMTAPQHLRSSNLWAVDGPPTRPRMRRERRGPDGIPFLAVPDHPALQRRSPQLSRLTWAKSHRSHRAAFVVRRRQWTVRRAGCNLTDACGAHTVGRPALGLYLPVILGRVRYRPAFLCGAQRPSLSVLSRLRRNPHPAPRIPCSATAAPNRVQACWSRAGVEQWAAHWWWEANLGGWPKPRLLPIGSRHVPLAPLRALLIREPPEFIRKMSGACKARSRRQSAASRRNANKLLCILNKT
jgi:hypothetical protein